MLLTGIGFAGLTTFWPMMVVAVAGTLNPSSGDVSVFLPTEQAALAHTVGGPARTMTFAGYNLVGSLAGAVGALASGVPALAAARWGVSPLRAERGVFVFYALCAVVAAIVYERLSPALEIHAEKRAAHPLAESRAVVLGGTLKAVYDLALLVQFRGCPNARGRRPLTLVPSHVRRTRWSVSPTDAGPRESP